MPVFLPQEVMYMNEKKELVPKFSTHMAEEFGEVKTLLPYGKVMLSPQPMINRLRKELQHFDDNDYLLPVGDPAAIGASMAIAALNNRGRLKLLRWDRASRRYTVTKMDLNGGSYD